jgi:hypothetical protein
MIRIAPYMPVPAIATAAQAAEMMMQYPAVAKYFEAMSRSSKTRTRQRLTAAGYPETVVDIVLPPVGAGAPIQAPVAEGSPWLLVSGPARRAIMDALEIEELPSDATYWTAAVANRAANAIASRHPENDSTASMYLGRLRGALALVYAPAKLPDDVRNATLRPDITRARNLKGAERLAVRIEAGVEVPEPFKRIADLRARVLAFVSGETPPSGQTLADLLTAFAARPGEADKLELGERGGVKGITAGVLKKRGADGKAVYPLISALGDGLAGRLLTAWKGIAARDRIAAKKELNILTRGWGIVPRDLRAIGAALAVRAEVLEDHGNNAGQQREALRGALRHEPSPAQAREYYERVNDPLAKFYAKFAELTTEDRARLIAEVDRLAAVAHPAI